MAVAMGNRRQRDRGVVSMGPWYFWWREGQLGVKNDLQGSIFDPGGMSTLSTTTGYKRRMRFYFVHIGGGGLETTQGEALRRKEDKDEGVTMVMETLGSKQRKRA